MKLIVGLGNPGRAYKDSRHNIGFSVVKALAKIYKVALAKNKATFSLNAKVKIKGENVILAVPLTFMNLSGKAVEALLKKHKINSENLLVVCDDLDLEFGRLKIRPGGSSGGHRGIESVIRSLKTSEFARLRIGIGRGKADLDVSRYVLSPFSNIEKKERDKIIDKTCNCCRVWVSEGILKSMNFFNTRTKYS
jgi:PTH1 family peptidyl-tRNA hydrolase